MNQLVTTDWLDKNIEKVKILDASWHLPSANRNSFEEYNTEHIINSIFFDIDKNSNQKTNLPHMLPSKEDWEIIVSSLGISNSDHIIVYDNSDVFSSCRVWYSFLYSSNEFLLAFGRCQLASKIFTFSIFLSNQSVFTNCFIIGFFQYIFDDIPQLYNSF